MYGNRSYIMYVPKFFANVLAVICHDRCLFFQSTPTPVLGTVVFQV